MSEIAPPSASSSWRWPKLRAARRYDCAPQARADNYLV